MGKNAVLKLNTILSIVPLIVNGCHTILGVGAQRLVVLEQKLEAEVVFRKNLEALLVKETLPILKNVMKCIALWIANGPHMVRGVGAQKLVVLEQNLGKGVAFRKNMEVLLV